MTLAEAVAAFEKDFTVSAEVGLADEAVKGRADMNRAPNGDRYVTLWAGGVRGQGEAPPVWVDDDEAAAAAEWLRSAWAYAEERGGKDLYWRERPSYRVVEYMAVDQVALIGDPVMRPAITLRIGCVYSRLAISRGETSKD